MVATEFEFTLPRGLVDEEGRVHRHGVMRLATAKDEMTVQKDRRIKESPEYSTLIMFSRVMVSLGTLTEVTPELLENLFSVDLSYLREFYNRINQQGNLEIPVHCPHCDNRFSTELALSGES